MPIDFAKTRRNLADFDFQRLFVENLGWSNPSARQAKEISINESHYRARRVAELAGCVVVEVEPENGVGIPDAKTRAAVHKEITKQHHENLLIFVDKERTQSLWYWAKRDDGRTLPRDHLFLKGQPGDLFLGKLSQM